MSMREYVTEQVCIRKNDTITFIRNAHLDPFSFCHFICVIKCIYYNRKILQNRVKDTTETGLNSAEAGYYHCPPTSLTYFSDLEYTIVRECFRVFCLHEYCQKSMCDLII